jgi:tRNA pseudouridine55 synthase
VHGVLLLDKPKGLSSHQALQKCKWLLRAEKGGHTGTLDPLATGVLPLCFGAATKFSQVQLDADKTYRARAVLGIKTSTGDAEGEVIERRPVPTITPERLSQVARQFTGAMRQVPPMHSALKYRGKALYEYARQGIVVQRSGRDVMIYALDIAPLFADETSAHDVSVVIDFTATVSKGTYIRTLAQDLGEALGCGAHLSALRRTATGPFERKRAPGLPAPGGCVVERPCTCHARRRPRKPFSQRFASARQLGRPGAHRGVWPARQPRRDRSGHRRPLGHRPCTGGRIDSRATP